MNRCTPAASTVVTRASAISMTICAIMESLKLRLVQARARQAEADIEACNVVDGEACFDDIEMGLRD